MPALSVRRTLAAIASGGVLAASGLLYAGEAKAEPVSGCQDDLWVILFQSSRRAICDGPIRDDGSWLRGREFYTPAHQVPLRTTCAGYYSVSCTTTGGYFQPRTSKGVELYTVTPDTVLLDEPGHLVNGFVA